jgi:hypothetical protein
MTELLKLAERCEREAGGMHLDQAILSALGYTWRGMAYWHRDGVHMWKHSSKLTTSLDAAVMLVPEGWRLRNMDQGEPRIRHLPPSAEIVPITGDDATWRAYEAACGDRHRMIGFGISLPMAICAVALKARAALKEQETERGVA